MSDYVIAAVYFFALALGWGCGYAHGQSNSKKQRARETGGEK